MNSQYDVDDHKLEIAYWYYKLNMTQAEIAKRLNFTRQRVNQIIGSLIDDGIVEIKINGLRENNIEMESAFEKYFKLSRVFIFDVEDAENQLDLFGQKAANAFAQLLNDNSIIGVSWGITLGAAVIKMQQRNLSGCKIVQMVGGLNSDTELAKPDEIARTLSKKLSCDYHLLYGPAVVDDPQAREVLMQDKVFAETFDLINRCDIAILGVGELSKSSTIYQQGFLSKERLEQLVAEGYVGDMAMQPFKKDGFWETENNVIGVSLETLRHIPRVAAVACGVNKANAVLGAINTGCLNVLIIDKAIALSIAKELSLDIDELNKKSK
ncbi:MAG: winged helix-turn-helix transcriptional regulator [Ruminococcaceae bacterium]|nr:winged helix-turn-helix transcriptional regulator [Oscillospiraceae bacterium]